MRLFVLDQRKASPAHRRSGLCSAAPRLSQSCLVGEFVASWPPVPMAGPWPTHANLSSTHCQKGAREGLSDGSYGEPQQQCGQDQPVVADRQLVVPRGDGAVLLDPGDHLLDHVALAVAYPPSVAAHLSAPRTRAACWSDRSGSCGRSSSMPPASVT